LSAGALPQTPLGELTALPRPPNWILGGLLLRGRGRDERGRESNGREGDGGQGKGGKERGKGEGKEGRGRDGERRKQGRPPR